MICDAKLMTNFSYDRSEPAAANRFQADSVRLILASHQRLLQRPLLAAEASGIEFAELLYFAPIAVLAHDGATDPVFFYANLAAQQAFAMNWEEITRLPSRFSAEPVARAERQTLLERVTQHGYIDDYSGIRIAADGTRFRIERATVWNLVDDAGRRLGQAAAFARPEAL